MNSRYVIVFAGVPGSSKSIIAYYLSESFALPMLSTDNIRFEVKEDMLAQNINQPEVLSEFKRRYDERLAQMLKRQASFIHDGSVDRRWGSLRAQLTSAGYRYFLINLDFSKDFMTRLYIKTGREEAVEELDEYWRQHEAFKRDFAADIGVVITDRDFPKRNSVAARALSKFLS